MAHKQNVDGRLSLDFAYATAARQTRLVRCEQQPPLKVIRAFPLTTGGVLVHLHNLSGGVLAGDQLHLDVIAGAHTSVQLTSTSATRIYRSPPQTPAARQSNYIQIKTGGLLEYLPDPVIPFAGARYQQHTTIELDTDAGLFWWETLAPGRTARGELFAYEQLQISLVISTQGKPLAIEQNKIEPQLRPPTSPPRLGPYTYTASFYICRVGLQAHVWSSLERTLSMLAHQLSCPGETIWAVSTLVAHGLIVRALSCRGRDISAGLYMFWRAAKLALYEQEAILPRKI